MPTSRSRIGLALGIALLPAFAAEAMARRPGVIPPDAPPLPGWLTTGDGTAAVPRDQLKISWHGTAAVELRSGATGLMIDPYWSRPSLGTLLSGPVRPDEAAVRAHAKGLSAVFVGHSHFDHVLDGPLAARLTGATFYGSPTSVAIAAQEGVAPARRAALRDGETVRVGDFAVTAVETTHNDMPTQWLAGGDMAPGFRLPMGFLQYKNGPVYDYVVRWRGRTIVHVGSAELPDAKLRGTKADVALICVSGWKSNPTLWGRVQAAMHPAVLAPIHHDDFFKPFDQGFVEGLLAFHHEALGRIREAMPGTAIMPVSFFDDHRVRAVDAR